MLRIQSEYGAMMEMRAPPAVKALVIQGTAAVVVLVLLRETALFGASISPMGAAFAIGLVAMVVAKLWRLSSWWLPIQLFFAPALLWMLSMQVSPVWFLGALALLLVVYGGVFYGRVPLYLSSGQVTQTIATLLPNGPFRLIDLGCGLGGVVASLARVKPQGSCFGVEAALLPYGMSWLRRVFSRGRWAVAWGNFWRQDLGQFDVIYAYLSPVPMLRLRQKLQAEMQPAALFISNTFSLPDVEPTAVVELQDINHSVLYVYHHANIIGHRSCIQTTVETRYVENR